MSSIGSWIDGHTTGIAIGGVGGYIVAKGHGDRFLSFIISHGSFELTAIAISGAINLSTSSGTGTWSLLSGRGTLVGGAPNSGNATYQFISESQVVLALTHPAGSMTAHATDGTFGDQESPALTITSCGIGKFNACEVSSPRCTPVAGSNVYGRLFTKLANTGFQLDLVALDNAGLRDASFNKSATINLLANTNTPVLNSGTNCPASQTATIAVRSIALGDLDVADARLAGLDDAALVEVVANVALSIFTNYFNHVAETDIDFPRAAPVEAMGPDESFNPEPTATGYGANALNQKSRISVFPRCIA